MADPVQFEQIRLVIGTPLTDREVQALAEYYANLSGAVASFPETDLKGIEPPLRSTPGPVRR